MRHSWEVHVVEGENFSLAAVAVLMVAGYKCVCVVVASRDILDATEVVLGKVYSRGEDDQDEKYMTTKDCDWWLAMLPRR